MIKLANSATVPINEFTILLREVVENTTYDVYGVGTFSAAELLETHCRRSSLDREIRMPPIQPQVPEGLILKLTQQLRFVLDQFIIDDRIGNGFAYFVGGTVAITVADFALELVRAAALLGPEQATQVLYGWAQDEPVPYRSCAVLSGVTVDQSMEMNKEIRFESLPSSSDELAAHLPRYVSSFTHTPALLGAVKVTIDCKAKPALYRFTGYNPNIIEHTWAYGPFSDVSLDTLCESLSLACNNYVSWITCWFECDATKEFGRLGKGLGRRPLPDNIFSYTTVNVSQQHLDEAHTIMNKRFAEKNAGRGLDLSIRRWVRSKRPMSHVDQFIELRIALEALYLPDTRNEVRFHLATRGAWHLGADLDERRKYHKTLRDAYDCGSKAVHASGVESSEENHKLLADAQDLCRQGILRRLDEPGEPNWNDLILGKELEANP